jgi:O-antigen/teichoic acid export membrane protein
MRPLFCQRRHPNIISAVRLRFKLLAKLFKYKNMAKDRIANLSIRISILGGKFLAVILLAKMMTVSDFGLYNIILAYVAFAVLLYGFDFYAHSHRYYVRRVDHRKATISHAVFSIIMIFLFSPFAYMFLRSDGISISLSILVVILFAVEYTSQELYRYLLIENRQIDASLGLLLRTTLWVPPLILYGYLNKYIFIFDAILFWLSGSFISIIYYFRKLQIRPNILNLKVDHEVYMWIFEGVKKSTKFLLGTLALRLVFTIDRKAAQQYSDIEAVAIYGFSISFAMVIFTIVDATVLSYSYPRILREKPNFRKYKELLRNITYISLISFFVVFILINSSIIFFDLNEKYLNPLAYFCASIATFFYAMSMAPHYYLYSSGKDKSLVITHLLIALLSVFILFGIFKTGEPWVISLKMAVIMFFLFCIKHILLLIATNKRVAAIN